MGKLNIAHHKSYHPYRRDNIERVRRDEEEARLKEEKEDGRIMLADSEARIDLLRQKAGISDGTDKKTKKRRDDDDMKQIASSSSMGGAILPTTNGHINLFEDLEQTQSAIASAIRASRKTTTTETEKGVPLAPSEKDLKPWYSGRDREKPVQEGEDEKRRREDFRKSVHDPLTSITKQLASRPTTSTASFSRHAMRPPPLPKAISEKPPEVQARLSREMSERERALELIRRKKRDMEGSATPSTAYGDSASEYRDVYNRREVEEAHKHRDRHRDGGYGGRKWDDNDRSRSRRARQW